MEGWEAGLHQLIAWYFLLGPSLGSTVNSLWNSEQIILAFWGLEGFYQETGLLATASSYLEILDIKVL